MTKERISSTIEADLLAAGRQAVAEGRAQSLSAWVSGGLRRQAEHDLRMRALDEFIRAYEAEHGEITPQEIRDATKRMRGRAVVVRGAGPKTKRAKRGVE